MSKLSEAERALLRDLQAVLKKHGAEIRAEEYMGMGWMECGDLNIYSIRGTGIDSSSFTQSDIDGDKESDER